MHPRIFKILIFVALAIFLLSDGIILWMILSPSKNNHSNFSSGKNHPNAVVVKPVVNEKEEHFEEIEAASELTFNGLEQKNIPKDTIEVATSSRGYLRIINNPTQNDVKTYLNKMKKSLSGFKQLNQDLSKLIANPSEAALTNNDWIKLADTIQSVPTPKEMSSSHQSFIDSIRKIGTITKDAKNNANPALILGSLAPAINDLSNTMSRYQQDTKALMSKYKVDSSFNPVN